MTTPAWAEPPPMSRNKNQRNDESNICRGTATMLPAQTIELGVNDNDIVVAGGMESMSNAPKYRAEPRKGSRLGHDTIIDGMLKIGYGMFTMILEWEYVQMDPTLISMDQLLETHCVAIIRNNQLFVANAGDSRCVISRKGQAYNLSRDHKPDLKAEKDRILKAGGFVQYGWVNGSLNLARAIDMELKQNKSLPAEKQIVTAYPDVNTVELCDDDEFLVIACDGICSLYLQVPCTCKIWLRLRLRLRLSWSAYINLQRKSYKCT
ncbi:putative protein phosphatase 2C 60 [Camellia lanceoleosa]|uniref:Uncharacterized protein n=1 Tax=Camellia lanceoleosa TaxID=1840588 RepID=A0ACC0HF62_9ERIC|nr:putative protein phosphatase 2C 60 [Camellia lanceoleosa]